MTIDKPSYGSPCNGCGLCCMASLCPLASLVFVGHYVSGDETQGRCPALEAGDGGAYRCGLVAHPEKYAPNRTARNGREPMATAAVILIGAGHGCDWQREQDLAVPASRGNAMRALREKREPLVPTAMFLWGAIITDEGAERVGDV